MAKPSKPLKPANEIIVEAQNVDPDNFNKIALRRGKVRELMRMGYGALSNISYFRKRN